MNASQAIPTQSAAPAHSARKRFLTLLALIVFAAAPFWHLHVIKQVLPVNYSDLLPRWAGTRLALEGGDPYNFHLLGPMQEAFHVHAQPFFYPATVVTLLAPLAPLSMENARLAFLIVVIPLFAVSLWLLMKTPGLPQNYQQRLVVVGFALISWPSIWSFRLQQLSLVVAALLFVAWFLLARGYRIAPGVLLAMTTMKPQLVLPLLFWLLIWSLLHRRWAFIASFAVSLAVWLLITARLVPGWFSHWRASLHNYTQLQETAPPLELLMGHWIGLLLTIVIVSAAALALCFLFPFNADTPQFAIALSLVLAATLCIVPTAVTMIYNNVLLFPACLILIYRKPQDRWAAQVRFLALLQLGWNFIAVAIAALCELVFHPSPFWNAFPYMDFFLASLVAISLTLVVLRQPRTGVPSRSAPAVAHG